ncbi:MAG: single-stranded DNA-binding protein [Bacteroidales bacterium]|nr:single-stranded DNA-binding protein [Bacteroidales bacterium]
MSHLRNQVNLIGNLGMDPEIKVLENGKKVARFSIATSERFRNSEGEQVKETQWHQVVAWGGSAGIAEQFLKKGKEVALSGRLSHRSYEDKDGNTRYMTEVIVNEIVLLGNGQKD